jgi:methionyl aminopeptidase
MLLADLA